MRIEFVTVAGANYVCEFGRGLRERELLAANIKPDINILGSHLEWMRDTKRDVVPGKPRSKTLKRRSKLLDMPAIE